MRTKVNIAKWNFYIQMAVVGLFIIFLTFHITSDLVNNTTNANNRALASGLNEGTDKFNEFVSEIVSETIKNWTIQYLVSSIFAIMYLLYLMFAISKIQIGYLFVGIWLLVWFGFALAPLVLSQRFTWFDVIDIILFVVVFVSMFFVVKDLYSLKKINNSLKMKRQIKNI